MVDSIGSVLNNSATLQQTGLGQDDFLKILLTQLSFQDPLKPMDNQQFIAQMAQFSSLELTKEQNDQVTSLLTMQSSNQAIGLIGKTVNVTTATGVTVGTVTTVTFQNGTPSLSVLGTDNIPLTGVKLSQIELVR